MIENIIKEDFELENYLPYQLDYTSNFNKSFRREFQYQYISKEITADEFAILVAIIINPEVSQSELAKLLFKGKAHVGKILNEMEERELIKRFADTRDNIIIKRNLITDKGLEIFHYGMKQSQIIKTKMAQEFTSDEIKQFISYLKRFRTVLNSIVDVKLK